MLIKTPILNAFICMSKRAQDFRPRGNFQHSRHHPYGRGSFNHRQGYNPNRRQYRQYSSGPRRKAISFDIDGTLVDIQKRLALSPGVNGVRKPKDWNIVLSGEHYHLDEPIEIARRFVQYCADQDFQILYISGRREQTLHDSKNWFEAHNYPQGEFYHRKVGVKSHNFKTSTLWNLNKRYNIIAHFGDRLEDDVIGAVNAKIQPVLVVPNEWVSMAMWEGGLKATIELHPELYKEGDFRHDKAHRVSQQSRFWSMSYENAMPRNFTTDFQTKDEVDGSFGKVANDPIDLTK